MDLLTVIDLVVDFISGGAESIIIEDNAGM
jgi:hypothetical protein